MMDAMPMTTGVMPTVELGNNNNGYGNGYGWGEWIWIIVLFALFGFGNNGFGFGGNRGLESVNCGRGVASPEDVSSGFALNKIDNQLNGIANGLCDSTYALNNSINGIGSQMAQCCCETQKEIIENRYTNQLAVQGLQTQLGTCCCDIEKAISDQNFLNAQNTNAIIQASNDNTRAILDKMCQNEIQSLRDQNQAYAMQLSQQAQTANLLEQLQPVSKPAYITCSPYQSALYPFNGYGFGYGFGGYNNNCGCGCGCGCNNI